MASLYIKDAETAALAAQLSQRLGISKTAAVKRALGALDRSIPEQPTAASLLAALDDWRTRHPLPSESGAAVDKAFFDAMWDEDD